MGRSQGLTRALYKVFYTRQEVPIMSKGIIHISKPASRMERSTSQRSLPTSRTRYLRADLLQFLLLRFFQLRHSSLVLCALVCTTLNGFQSYNLCLCPFSPVLVLLVFQFHSNLQWTLAEVCADCECFLFRDAGFDFFRMALAVEFFSCDVVCGCFAEVRVLQ